ncbi:MAG: alanine racemase, partial [Candidatus Hermodarchaeota archaeon]
MKKLSGNPYLKAVNGNLFMDQVELTELLKVSNTPIMIFLENKIRSNLKTFNKVFKSIFKNFECYYSLKANYLPEICTIIQSEGVGAEAIGLPELKLALITKFSSDKILVGGPYLPDVLIEKAIKNQVREIIVYDLKDLKRINLTAQKNNRVQDICVRINSQKYGSRLGVFFDNENLSELKEKIQECKNIRVVSILSHYTSQMNNIEQFKKNLKSIIDNLQYLTRNGINIKNINL